MTGTTRGSSRRGPGRGAPDRATAVPDAVRRLADGADLEGVWENEVGGLTYRFAEHGGTRYVKWSPAGNGYDLGDEALRLEWAGRYTPVPTVLASGSDELGSWLVTADLGGSSAVDERWRARPATATRAIGEGLRAMHEALPVATCPFAWSREERVAAARRAPADVALPYEFAEWRRDEALEVLADPPDDDPVVCHADPCAPNTLIGEDGRWLAHVDLGRLGVADRWADLAVASWSAGWNYGWEWQSAVYEAYGVAPDERRVRYYRLLWAMS